MNEDRKKRGLANGKFFTAVAICALFLGSGNVMAAQTASDDSQGVQEQMQSISVTVTVVDTKGEPIIGANVIEKGTTNGGITDLDGVSKLNVKPGAILQVSFVGYTTQEVKATSVMKVVLKDDTELLDEVVVVGYGAQKKVNLTGAVASVDVNKTIDSRPITDIGRALQGAVPGLTITTNSGEIGGAPTIKIRGSIGSPNGDSKPLILVDNVEVTDISMVNPDDIESISVLKDAASASIYGARGAFGVLLITTKSRSKHERLSVKYTNNFAWRTPTKTPEQLPGWQQADINLQGVINTYLCSDGLPIGQSPLYQGKEDPSIQKSFQDRDPRLYQTVADSLRIMSAMGTNYTEGTSPTGYPTKKFLNDEWWVAGLDYCTGRLSPADAPCIRYAEVLLNYVEARYEIAQVGGNAFSQSDLDKSINELRDRQLTKWGDTEAKTMPKVQLNGSNLSVNGVVINDPARDPDVNPVLWEIRRERRIELIMEGRRGEDLRRWAKFEYLNSEDANGYPTMSFLGAYVNMADYPEISSKDDSGKRVLYLFDPENPGNEDTEKGYIYYLREKELRIFKAGELNSERYYLRAIPAAQLTIYENKGQVLTQNPGW